MKKRNRIIIAVSAVICLVSIATAVFFLVTRQNVREEKMSLQGKFEELVLNKEELARAVKELEDSKASTEEKLKNSEESVKNIFSQLDEERKRNAGFNDAIMEKDGEIRKLRAAVENYQDKNAALSKRLEALNKDFDAAKSELDELAKREEESREAIEKLTKKLETLTKKDRPIPLGTIVINK